MNQMKQVPDSENEIHDIQGFVDAGQNVVIPLLKLPGDVMRPLVAAFQGLVQHAAQFEKFTRPDEDGVTRTQTFEEGDVFMTGKPFDGYVTSRYLMDFYNTEARGICSRMHLHTGIRYVRMMTGPATKIRVSSLSPFIIADIAEATGMTLEAFKDEMPDLPAGQARTRYNVVVPENSIVDLQVPQGVSHQFNAVGPYSVLDSVHPEESVELFREHMRTYRMMAQTIFLTEDRPSSETCALPHTPPT